MNLLIMFALVLVGVVGIWLGFAEDIEIATLTGFLAMAAATLQAFRGGFGPVPELPEYVAPVPPSAKPKRQMSKEDLATTWLAFWIVVGSLAGAAGLWSGFAWDFEIGMLLGVLVAAGATLAAFRGKAAF